VANAVAQACETIGFFVITGHGIAPDILTRLIAEARAFFDLPEAREDPDQATWQKFRRSDLCTAQFREPWRAWMARSARRTSRSPSTCHRATSATSGCAGTEPLQDAWSEAYAAYEALAADLRALFCAAAGLPEDTLEPAFAKHASSTRMLNYPEVHGKLQAGQTRAGVHTDYGAFTVIRGDDAPGLQVRALDGTWIDVPAVPGSFVVNIGDLLMRWTNDRWISTPHRVVTLADTEYSPRRQSIAFFCNPGPHAVIECLPPFVPADGAPKYPPIRYQAYAESKFREQVGDPDLELPIDTR
jgi:isopenicillin N synthase-like dioxygenase